MTCGVLITGVYTAGSDVLAAPHDPFKNHQRLVGWKPDFDDDMLPAKIQNAAAAAWMCCCPDLTSETLHLWSMSYVIVPWRADALGDWACHFNRARACQKFVNTND